MFAAVIDGRLRPVAMPSPYTAEACAGAARPAGGIPRGRGPGSRPLMTCKLQAVSPCPIRIPELMPAGARDRCRRGVALMAACVAVARGDRGTRLRIRAAGLARRDVDPRVPGAPADRVPWLDLAARRGELKPVTVCRSSASWRARAPAGCGARAGSRGRCRRDRPYRLRAQARAPRLRRDENTRTTQTPPGAPA